jgi:hypothetical protein
MSYAPKTMLDLQAYWRAQKGVSLGIVGDTRHTKGYHLGKDRIYDGAGPGLGDADYSVKTTRDKRGLTNGAAGIDLGKLGGSYVNLRTFSKWLVARARANAPGTSMLREIIYSPDGKTVLRWDRQRGYASAPRPGEADASHLTHTHLSFYRDTEAKDKRPIFAPYFATAPVPPPEDQPMPSLSAYLPGYVAVLKGTSNVRTEPKLSATLLRTVPAGQTETWTITGFARGEKDTDGSCTTTDWACRYAGGRWEYTSRCNLTGDPKPPADDTPYSKADLEAASRASYNGGLDAAGVAVASVQRK